MHEVNLNVELSHAGIDYEVNRIEQAIEDGQTDGLEALVFAKWLEELAKSVKASKIVKESASDEYS